MSAIRNPMARSLMLAAAVTLFALPANAEDMPSSALQAADMSGVPEGFDSETWMAASGTASVIDHQNGSHIIEITADDLVPDGIYTIWWVNEATFGMDMGPGGGLPANTFTADHEGNAATQIAVDSDNDYQMMVIAYHADHRTHGDMPGEMGEVTFEHLMGPWPGPGGEMPM